jgi:hypothetical protein
MEQVVITESVYKYLDELVEILYEEEYKGFVESAIDYVNTIFDFLFSIPSYTIKNTYNNIYGNYYCKHKHNQKTTWYAIFDKEEDDYIIKKLINNHSAEYPQFITYVT